MEAQVSWARTILGVSARALLAAILVLLTSWTLVECAPGSLAERAAIASRAIPPGDVDMPVSARTAIVFDVGELHGLNASFGEHLLKRSTGLLRLDFGNSWRDGDSVRDALFSDVSILSLFLCLAALAMATLVGGAAAVWSARFPKGLGDRSADLVAALLLSVPLPWIAMLLASTFSYGTPFSFMPTDGGAISLILPLLVLASVPAVVVWRHLREELERQSRSPWVLSAMAKGVSEKELWRRHIVRASLPNLLSLFPILLAYLFGAELLVERVFALDGIGERISRAAATGDAPLLIGAAVLIGLVISITTSVSRLVSLSIDPRRK